jgi:hypothetical protein
MAAISDSGSDARRREVDTPQANKDESHVISACAGAAHQIQLAMASKGCFDPERMASGKLRLALRQREAASLKDGRFAITLR